MIYIYVGLRTCVKLEHIYFKSGLNLVIVYSKTNSIYAWNVKK